MLFVRRDMETDMGTVRTGTLRLGEELTCVVLQMIIEASSTTLSCSPRTSEAAEGRTEGMYAVQRRRSGGGCGEKTRRGLGRRHGAPII